MFSFFSTSSSPDVYSWSNPSRFHGFHHFQFTEKKLSVLAFAGEKKLYRFTTVQKNKFYFRAGFFMRRDGAVKSRISAENEEDKVLFIFAN
jgi:hypothetical protein